MALAAQRFRLLASAFSSVIFFVSTSSACAQVGGVYFDAKGMLRETKSLSQNEKLNLLRKMTSGNAASDDVASRSNLRRISLKRLERQVKAFHKKGEPLPADLFHLAGLTQIRFVFFYPQEHDVVIAGEAEGWTQTETGEVVGKKSGKPVLNLDDLIVALRYAFAEQVTTAFVGCSIDPTVEGTKRFNNFTRNIPRNLNRAQMLKVLKQAANVAGPHRARIFGIDPSSGFALKMLVADYRLKRIALAHDPSPVKGLTSYFDLLARKRNLRQVPQHRWWFVGHYDAIEYSADELAYEFTGQGLKVATAPTEKNFKTDNRKGKRKKASKEAEKFASDFTQHFPQLAKKVPVFAELKNLISLTVTAELIAQKHFERVSSDEAQHWHPTFFLDKKACPIEKFAVPKWMPALVNYRFINNRNWLISVSGGVELDPAALLTKHTLKLNKTEEFQNRHRSTTLPTDKQTWWWD